VRLAGAATAILAIAAMEGRVAWKGRDPPPRGDLVASAARLDRLCLRGEFFFLTFTEQGLHRSAEAWDQALILAPGHARAHAGRALTTGVHALLDQLSPDEAEPLMRDAQQRALRLDPACPAAHLATSLARLLFDWDAAGAAAAARTATTADPHDLRGPIVLALALQGEGELAQSEQILETATLDDPYSAAAAFLEGRTHEMQARWDEAVAAYGRALALEPGLASARRGRAECLTAAGNGRQALAALGVVASDPADVLGDPLRPAWRRLCVDGEVSAETVRACVLGGDVERGERLLAAAVAGRSPFVVLAPHEALLQPLRQGLVMRALVVRLQQLPPS
jgi:tetratricopeptide (TPR) repeat protein